MSCSRGNCSPRSTIARPSCRREAALLEQSVAQTKADDDIEVRYAQKSFELAQAELQRDLDINRKSAGSVPESEVHRKQLAQHRAELQIDRSRLDLKVAQMTADVHSATVRATEESIRRRRIEAPFAGLVADVYREAAEWVNAGEAVLRVVRMDQLRVDGFLDGSQFTAADVARRPVTIVIQLPPNRVEQFPGEVVFVSPIMQAGNQYRVTAEVQNAQRERCPAPDSRA
jgi:multidrug resistance efflux pump